jgi:hypothetical protein
MQEQCWPHGLFLQWPWACRTPRPAPREQGRERPCGCSTRQRKGSVGCPAAPGSLSQSAGCQIVKQSGSPTPSEPGRGRRRGGNRGLLLCRAPGGRAAGWGEVHTSPVRIPGPHASLQAGTRGSSLPAELRFVFVAGFLWMSFWKPDVLLCARHSTRRSVQR